MVFWYIDNMLYVPIRFTAGKRRKRKNRRIFYKVLCDSMPQAAEIIFESILYIVRCVTARMENTFACLKELITFDSFGESGDGF